jgi:PIN domain nuclease of toxin-antitoxin system
MRLLLDTHIFLWCVKDDQSLSKNARILIQEADEIYISSASIWEATIKIGLGKLSANISDLIPAIYASGFLELPITAKHAASLIELPHIHRDPFDRMLLAQAMCEPLRFLTADAKLKEYSDLVQIV